jgi:hypothetical protein
MMNEALGKETVGNRLRALRQRDHRLTQQAVAEAVGVSRAHLARIETSDSLPGREALAALADYYGVAIDYILNGATEPPAGPASQAPIRPQRFASVWDALEETPEDAANMRLRSELMIALAAIIETWGLTQAQASRRLGITQPRLNDLLRGRISRFSLDALIGLAERAGQSVRLELAPAAA